MSKSPKFKVTAEWKSDSTAVLLACFHNEDPTYLGHAEIYALCPNCRRRCYVSKDQGTGYWLACPKCDSADVPAEEVNAALARLDEELAEKSKRNQEYLAQKG